MKKSSKTLVNKELLTDFLKELKLEFKLNGILVTSKDGKKVIKIIDDQFQSKKFSAMCASVFRSAQDIGIAAENRSIDKIITRLEENNIILMSINRDYFLTLICDENSKVQFFLKKRKENLKRILEFFRD
ncbi:MAG: hypothetical protein BAJALOKI2v1_30036 [Promethearchaeota archaeon]|nr:MAG: hypothetical protein BAJALOKI2v1_30036 [Candidatus Lokiarchaeota archaeon]